MLAEMLTRNQILRKLTLRCKISSMTLLIISALLKFLPQVAPLPPGNVDMGTV